MRKHLWVLLAFLFISLVLTWPLAVQFPTHVPGDGIDDPALAWNLWWVKHALVDRLQNPFSSDWQFWPIGINLAFYTLTVLNGLLSVPLQAVFGLIPAYNLLLLFSFVLSGFGAYLLGLDFLRSCAQSRGSRFPASLHPRVAPAPPLPIALPAFLGGAFYAFASAKLFYAALGQGNIASSQWIPFAALYMIRAARPAGRARDAVLAALFLVLQAYAELTYASFLVVFAVFVVGWRLIEGALGDWKSPLRLRSRPAPTGDQATSVDFAAVAVVSTAGAGRLIVRFVLLGALFAVGIAPILANMLPDLRAEGDFFTSGGGFADVFSADLAGYLVPTQLHPVLGGVIRTWRAAAQAAGRQFAVDKGQHIYVGYVALALAAVALWRGRRQAAVWFWAAAALLFFALTLGPNLRVAGADTGIPLPFRLFETLPFFKGNRYPSRYSVMLLVSLAPLVALGARRMGEWANDAWRMANGKWRMANGRMAHGEWANDEWRMANGEWRISGRRSTQYAIRNTHHASRITHPISLFPCFLVSLFTFLLLFEHLSAPLPTFNLGAVPALYDRVTAEPGDFALLELPLGWRNGARVAGKQDVLIMQQLWYQSYHGKRLLGGNTSRNPEYKFQYFSEDPTLARLIALTNAADVAQHDALRATLADLPVTDDDRAAARAWAAFLNIRYVMVHRAQLPPQAEALIRDLLPLVLVAEEADLALYRLAEPLTRPTLFFPGTDQGRSILGEGWSPPVDAATPQPVYAQRRAVRLLLPLPPQAVTLRLEGYALAPAQSVTVLVDGREIGRQPWPQEPTQLAFALPANLARPPLSDVRLRFAQVTPVTELAQQLSRPGPVGVLVRSAGQETGDFGHIYIDGVERSPNQRGYNLVAFDAVDGTVLAAASFDTHADPAAGAALAQWVAALPPGAAVAGAVRDEAALNLSQEGVAALRSLGVNLDLRGQFRRGHAFLGQVGGGAAAAAAEASDGMRPAQVQSGLALSAPQVAVALVRVEIVK